MLTQKNMQTLMGYMLLLGVVISTSLVAIGGAWYLAQHGQSSMQSELFQADSIATLSIQQLWSLAFTFSPLGMIELGLLLLVSTQTLRVVLLCWFYAALRDYPFFLMSMFILLILIYSSFWHT